MRNYTPIDKSVPLRPAGRSASLTLRLLRNRQRLRPSQQVATQYYLQMIYHFRLIDLSMLGGS